MKYDTEILQSAFQRFKDTHTAPTQTLAKRARVGVATVNHLIRFGVGHPDNVDRIAKALGLKRGVKDVITRAS